MKKIFFYRDKLFIWLVDCSKPIYGKLFQRSNEVWPYDLANLKKLPKGTLGNDLACWLEKEGLELMPKFESHDVYHVLLKYKTTVVDEARMQFFLWGNGKRSLYIIGTIIMAILFIPEHISSFRKEYHFGKKCTKIFRWNFLFLLKEPTTLLRDQIFNLKTEEKPFII